MVWLEAWLIGLLANRTISFGAPSIVRALHLAYVCQLELGTIIWRHYQHLMLCNSLQCISVQPIESQPLLVLIDESGDAGFKIAKGSTSHFIVAMVIFRDFKEAERASIAIAEARSRLRIKSEFKFNKSSHPVRDAFFEALAPFHFGVRAVVVHKSRIYNDNLRENKDLFYSYFVKLLLKHDDDALQNAKVKIDGSGDREFKRELERYLKQQVQAGKIVSVKFSESHRDNLIQLADMAAGAIARSYRDDDRKYADRWRKMLARKIEDVWDFK